MHSPSKPFLHMQTKEMKTEEHAFCKNPIMELIDQVPKANGDNVTRNMAPEPAAQTEAKLATKKPICLRLFRNTLPLYRA